MSSDTITEMSVRDACCLTVLPSRLRLCKASNDVNWKFVCRMLETAPVKDLWVVGELGGFGAIKLCEPLNSKQFAVTFLDLTGVGIDSMGIKTLSYPLRHNKTIKTLILRKNGFGAMGYLAFSVALVYNRTITELDLAETSVGGDASAYLAAALCANNSIRYLNLAGNPKTSLNGIGDLGAVRLFETLEKKNRTLQEIDFSYNVLCDSEVEALVHVLKENSVLRALRMRGNRFTDDSARLCERYLTEYPHISLLDLGGVVLLEISSLF